MAQWVKDPALSLQQLHLLLWRGFDPWPGELLPTAGVAKKEKKKILINASVALHISEGSGFPVHFLT